MKITKGTNQTNKLTINTKQIFEGTANSKKFNGSQ
jgi:hypothetical protein